jgi:hypothetical protein
MPSTPRKAGNRRSDSTARVPSSRSSGIESARTIQAAERKSLRISNYTRGRRKNTRRSRFPGCGAAAATRYAVSDWRDVRLKPDTTSVAPPEAGHHVCRYLKSQIIGLRHT